MVSYPNWLKNQTRWSIWLWNNSEREAPNPEPSNCRNSLVTSRDMRHDYITEEVQPLGLAETKFRAIT